MKAMIYLFCFLKVCYSNVFLACIFANTKDIIVTKIVVYHKTAPEAIFLNHGSFNIIVRNKNIYIYIFSPIGGFFQQEKYIHFNDKNK